MKSHAEAAGTGKAHLVGDLFQGQAILCQQRLCLRNAYLLHVGAEALAGAVLECLTKMIDAQAAEISEFLQADFMARSRIHVIVDPIQMSCRQACDVGLPDRLPGLEMAGEFHHQQPTHAIDKQIVGEAGGCHFPEQLFHRMEQQRAVQGQAGLQVGRTQVAAQPGVFVEEHWIEIAAEGSITYWPVRRRHAVQGIGVATHIRGVIHQQTSRTHIITVFEPRPRS